MNEIICPYCGEEFEWHGLGIAQPKNNPNMKRCHNCNVTFAIIIEVKTLTTEDLQWTQE